ncbi:acetyltransferase [Humibacter sp. BT305]|nr:acetyltransferase [Humibacter sp. BT305]
MVDTFESPTSGRVVPLRCAPGARAAWGRSSAVVYLWGVAERLLVTNSWQISSRLRCATLRLFGAQIGERVTFRPRTRVLFPWKLVIGDDCWIGEGVWFHNQDTILLEHDVVISQETFLTTGSHAHRRDMALLTRPITIKSGAWITSRCVVLGGVTVGRSALVTPGSVVSQDVAPERIISQSPTEIRDNGWRFEDRQKPGNKNNPS